AAFTWTFGLTTIALGALVIGFFGNLLWLELRRPDRDTPRTLVTALYLLGFGVAVGVDVVTLKNDIVRMNTVFKFSLQAWQLMALASAFAAWYCLRSFATLRASTRTGRIRRADWRDVSAWAGTVTIVVLMFGASIFIF